MGRLPEVLTLLLAVGPALLVLFQGLWIGPRYDRFVLPAFDGFVYDGMAESPRVFTLAPWGYRIVEPWIVHLLPVSSPAAGFFWLNLFLLSGAVFLVGRWLRRLGYSPVAAMLGGLTLALTPAMRTVLDYQVLVDPLTLFLTVSILNALVTPHWLTLSALFAVGALAKEMCLMPLLVVPFALASRFGWKRSMWQSLGAGAPAVGLLILLRMTWGDGGSATRAAFLPSPYQRFGEVPASYAIAFLGLTVLGALGFARERSPVIRSIGAVLWFGNFLAVMANPYGFRPSDLTRISLFALAPALPLALAGLGFSRAEVEPRAMGPNRWSAVASIAALLAALGLALATDSYQRATYKDSPSGVEFLGRRRESLKTARALDRGEAFTFDWQSGRFARPVTERFNLTEARQQRWFLYSGFGPDAVFGSGAPEFQGDAELLLPVFVPRPATISILIEGPASTQVDLSVAGLDLGSVAADGSAAELSVPQSALIRGDNILRLRGPEGVGVRVLHLEIRLASPDPAQN